MRDIENDETTIKHICHCYIDETYRASEIRTSGDEAECDCCGRSTPSVGIDELAERIEAAFPEHYRRIRDQPESWQERLMADRESHYDWNREGIPVNEAMQEAAGIDEELAADVLEILEEKYAPYPDKDNIGVESARKVSCRRITDTTIRRPKPIFASWSSKKGARL